MASSRKNKRFYNIKIENKIYIKIKHILSANTHRVRQNLIDVVDKKTCLIPIHFNRDTFEQNKFRLVYFEIKYVLHMLSIQCLNMFNTFLRLRPFYSKNKNITT